MGGGGGKERKKCFEGAKKPKMDRRDKKNPKMTDNENKDRRNKPTYQG